MSTGYHTFLVGSYGYHQTSSGSLRRAGQVSEYFQEPWRGQLWRVYHMTRCNSDTGGLYLVQMLSIIYDVHSMAPRTVLSSGSSSCVSNAAFLKGNGRSCRVTNSREQNPPSDLSDCDASSGNEPDRKIEDWGNGPLGTALTEIPDTWTEDFRSLSSFGRSLGITKTAQVRVVPQKDPTAWNM